MIHNLTIGHLDIQAVDERRAVVLKALDELAVIRHLKALGGGEGQGWTLDGMPVERSDGYVVCRWLVGPRRNLVAEEFAPRMIRDTGCQVIDREHYDRKPCGWGCTRWRFGLVFGAWVRAIDCWRIRDIRCDPLDDPGKVQ